MIAPISLVGIGAMCAACFASSGGAQITGASTLVATVGVESTHDFLPNAEVVITDLHRVGKTDWSGEAIVSKVPPGEHTVRVRAIGYEPIEVRLVFQRDSVAATFLLKRVSLTLDTIFVSAKHLSPGLKEFEARRAMGIGRFLTEQQLSAAANTFDFQTLMSIRFPGLKVITLPDGQHVLSSLRGSCGADHSRSSGMGIQPARSGTSCIPNAPCVVPVLLDGVDLHDAVDDIVRTWDLAGAEFYDGMQVPAEYHVSGYGCGVLLLWSRRP